MQDIKEVTDKLEQGVKDIFASEAYTEYLKFMAKFHNYSVNNSILIWLQKPSATLVAGYKTWQNVFKRQVRKGEKGIVILAPCPHKFIKRTEDEDGNVIEQEVQYTSFRATSVFDISQTDGADVPENPCHSKELTGDMEGYEDMLANLVKLSPVPVEFADIQTGAKGFFSPAEKKIVIKGGMSQTQTVKTLVHEIAHSLLHCKDGEQENVDRETKEVQAESVAFTVCSMLGLDTSDYSFGYVAGWSSGQETKELTASMEVIRKTANEIVKGLE